MSSAACVESRGPIEKNFTNEQIDAVKKIRAARDNYERLGLMPGESLILEFHFWHYKIKCESRLRNLNIFNGLHISGSSRDQINKQYKKMAILLHPDKSLAPGTEEAFKLLTIARSQLLRYAN